VSLARYGLLRHHTKARTGALAALFLLAVCTVTAARRADPSLRTVLSRLETYVERYEGDLSSLVAKERYVQTVSGRAAPPRESRTLISDFLFFRSPGRYGPWLGFRDVLEVDGAPVARQGERLRDIVASPESAESRAMTMALENARYNIGRFARTVNVPVCVVGWMHKDMRDRFSFKREGDEDLVGVRAWRIAFREKDRPTIVRTPEGRPVFSTGRIWVDPDDGRIMRTEQQNAIDKLRVTILVDFVQHTELGLLVPSRMQERFDDSVDLLETEAIYSDYRRFTATARIK
jgi:hypothetical protein